MKVRRVKCWKCKGAGTETLLIVGMSLGDTKYETKRCSVCRGTGRIEIKQDRIKYQEREAERKTTVEPQYQIRYQLYLREHPACPPGHMYEYINWINEMARAYLKARGIKGDHILDHEDFTDFISDPMKQTRKEVRNDGL